MKTALFAWSLGLAAAVSAPAQNVISAKSGMIHYTEGTVMVEDQTVEPKKGQFPELKNGQTLKTTEGRAEVLIGYSGYLRVAENSSILMLDNRLSETRIQVLSGTVLLECPEIIKGNSLTLVAATVPISIRKPGLYRVDLDQNGESSFKVYDGEASLGASDKPVIAKKGKSISLDGQLIASKFDAKGQDPLYRWASLRSDSLSLANLSSARGLMSYGNAWRGGWTWNPWYNMFTYVPYRGVYYSPFGGAYYSPGGVYALYNPPVQGGGSNGTGYNQNTYYDSGSNSMISPRSSSSTGSYGSVATSGSVGSSASAGDSGSRNTGGSSGRGDSSAGGRGK